MASNLPIARQVKWIFLVPQLIILALLMFAYFLADAPEYIAYGALSYLVLSYSLRNFIPLDHRVAMRLVHKRAFQNAIPYFISSYEFFDKHSWIDRYRAFTLLSSSAMCYREMALNNIAFCFSQTGQGAKAIEFYKRTLAEYPGNEMAKAALNLINSVS